MATKSDTVDKPGTPFVGRSLKRREDQRLLTGQGLFVADLTLPGMLHAAFVRSQVAHARIRSVDLSRAMAVPGVVYALGGITADRIAEISDTGIAGVAVDGSVFGADSPGDATRALLRAISDHLQ